VGVFDLDSIQFLQTVKSMRDQGVILGGEKLSRGPELFIGAAANPFATTAASRSPRIIAGQRCGYDLDPTFCPTW